jgi:DNA-binding SARP family transcriptional activator
MTYESILELPFIGRSKEIKKMKNTYNDVLGNCGKCVLVTGEPGIGKSRLIDQFVRHEARDAFVLSTTVQPQVFSAWEFLKNLVREYIARTDHGARVITKVIDSQLFNEFSHALPELKVYFPYESQDTKPKGPKHDLRVLFFQFIVNLSYYTPVILVIDDLHESTDEIFNMIEYLLHSIADLSVMIILGARERQNVMQWHDNCRARSMEKLILSRLDEQEISLINALMFQQDMDSAFLEWLTKKTRGIPLFLREFLYTLLDKGVVYYENTRKKWEVIKSYTEIAIPDHVADMIKSRFRGLPARILAFLQRASVFGETFDASLPILNAKKDILASCVRMGFIKRENGEYRFTHPLIREMLYAQIPQRDRSAMHQKLSRFFLKHNKKIHAADHLLQGRVSHVGLSSLLVKLSRDLCAAGDYERGLYYAEKAYLLMLDKKKIAVQKKLAILFNYSSCLFLYEKYGKVSDLSQTLLLLINEHHRPNRGQVAKYQCELAQAFLHLGRYQDGFNATDKGLAIIGKAGKDKYEETRVELLMYQAFLYKNMGQLNKSLHMAMKIEKEFGTSISSYNRYNINKLLGSVYNEKQNFKKAIEFRESALDAAQETRRSHLVAAAQGNLGVSYANTGEFRKGLEYLRRYQNYNIRAGRVRAEIVSYIHIAQIYFNQGYLIQAENEFEKGIKKCEYYGARFTEVRYELHFRYGTFLIVAEKYKQAHEHLNAAVELARELDAGSLALYALLNIGCLCAATRDTTGLKKVMKQCKDEFEDKLEDNATFVILEGFSQLFNSRTRQGLGKIKEGLSMLRKSGNQNGLFRLLYFCSMCLVQHHVHNKIAHIYLQEAHTIAESLQMTGWLNRFAKKSAASSVETLRIYCFGPLQVEHPCQGFVSKENWQRVKPRQFLSVLIAGMMNNIRVDREYIGTLLWPELPAQKVINNFHVCLHQLKSIIGKDYIKYTHGVYTLQNTWIDARAFEEMLSEADTLYQNGKIHLCESRLRAALELYQGAFMEDSYDTWVEEIRAEYRMVRRNRLLMLGEIYLKKLKFDSAIQIGKEILNSDPLDEEGHRFLIRTYLVSGEKAKAMNQYKKCVDIFKKELDCLPSVHTQEMYHKMRKARSLD